VGVLYVWEWDPVEWLGSPTGGGAPGGGGAAADAPLPHGASPRFAQRFSLGRAASGALFASADSRQLSGDAAAAAAAGGSTAGPGSPQAGGDGDGAATPSSGAGPEPPLHGFGPGGGGGVGGLLAKHENPLKVVSGAEGGPLLCCAWSPRGERAMVVAGSSAGWLVVIDLTKDEDEAQVAGRSGVRGSAVARSRQKLCFGHNVHPTKPAAGSPPILLRPTRILPRAPKNRTAIRSTTAACRRSTSRPAASSSSPAASTAAWSCGRPSPGSRCRRSRCTPRPCAACGSTRVRRPRQRRWGRCAVGGLQGVGWPRQTRRLSASQPHQPAHR
jgi:hypothetical protein